MDERGSESSVVSVAWKRPSSSVLPVLLPATQVHREEKVAANNRNNRRRRYSEDQKKDRTIKGMTRPRHGAELPPAPASRHNGSAATCSSATTIPTRTKTTPSTSKENPYHGGDWYLPPGAELIVRSIAAERIFHLMLSEQLNEESNNINHIRGQQQHNHHYTHQPCSWKRPGGRPRQPGGLKSPEMLLYLVQEFPFLRRKIFQFRIASSRTKTPTITTATTTAMGGNKNRTTTTATTTTPGTAGRMVWKELELDPLSVILRFRPPLALVQALYYHSKNQSQSHCSSCLSSIMSTTHQSISNNETSMTDNNNINNSNSTTITTTATTTTRPSFLMLACEYGAGLDVIQFLHDQDPTAISQCLSPPLDWYPLHVACRCAGIHEERQHREQEQRDVVVREGPVPVAEADHQNYNNTTNNRNNHDDANDTAHVIDFLIQQFPSALTHGDALHGCLPLHLAILGNASVDVVQCLVRASTFTSSVPAAGGRTPLHFACRRRQPEQRPSTVEEPITPPPQTPLIQPNDEDNKSRKSTAATRNPVQCRDPEQNKRHNEQQLSRHNAKSATTTVPSTTTTTTTNNFMASIHQQRQRRQQEHQLAVIKFLVQVAPETVHSASSTGWTPLQLAAAFHPLEILQPILRNVVIGDHVNDGNYSYGTTTNPTITNTTALLHPQHHQQEQEQHHNRFPHGNLDHNDRTRRANNGNDENILTDWTLLHLAVHCNTVTVVEWLARQFPWMTVMRRRSTGATPLHCACDRAATSTPNKARLPTLPTTTTSGGTIATADTTEASECLNHLIQTLVRLAPEARMIRNRGGQLPLDVALQHNQRRQQREQQLQDLRRPLVLYKRKSKSRRCYSSRNGSTTTTTTQNDGDSSKRSTVKNETSFSFVGPIHASTLVLLQP